MTTAATADPAERVRLYVRRHPDLTCEAIALELGELPAVVSVHLIALRKAGRLESTGRTRGTRWRVAAR